jgi:lipopolysaccharide export system protein LptA
MRAFVLWLLLAIGVWAQPKDISFQKITGGAFAGFNDDEKAEKAWEASAKFMKPTAEPGLWDLDQLRVQSFRAGKVQATFTSPYGSMNPTHRAAQGTSPITAQSPAFNLKGDGWSWRSTNQGDSFAVLANVVAELDLAKPIMRRWRIHAQRLDATPGATGTLLIFQGNIVMDRFGERITCERVECLLDDGPKGDGLCRTITAIGKVVRSAEKQTLRGDLALFDLKSDTLEMNGQVELDEPGLKASAERLQHATKLGVTKLWAADGKTVQLHTERKPGEKADISGNRVTLTRDDKRGLSSVEVQDNARYVSAQEQILARRILASETRAGASDILATGGVKGQLDGVIFEAGKAQWDRTKRLLVLEELPRLTDPNGIETAGFSIRMDLPHNRMEVRSAPGIRAAIRMPAGEEGGSPGLAEANQVVVTQEDGAMQIELLGSVHYVAAGVTTDSDQLVGFALPRAKGQKEFALNRAILTGHVRYAQSGLRCAADRIDLSPAVQVEEILKKDILTGNPRLLTLSGGKDLTRPRLFVTFSDGKSAEFIADAQEILTTPALTKFFLRGAVGMVSGDTEAACDLLEGIASPEKSGRQVARQMIGRGNVNVTAGGSLAKGNTLEILPEKEEARLFGNARIRDKSGNEGIPAKEIRYDMKNKAWHMGSAADEEAPGQVVRPKIFLGREFTLPEVKSLDNGR